MIAAPRLASLLCLSLALSAAGATLAAAAERAPYVGRWDCEVGIFTFTESTYDPGDGPLKIDRILRKDGDYHFMFEDGYGFWVSGVTAMSMGWLSDASGDAFTCKRLSK